MNVSIYISFAIYMHNFVNSNPINRYIRVFELGNLFNPPCRTMRQYTGLWATCDWTIGIYQRQSILRTVTARSDSSSKDYVLLSAIPFYNGVYDLEGYCPLLFKERSIIYT